VCWCVLGPGVCLRVRVCVCVCVFCERVYFGFEWVSLFAYVEVFFWVFGGFALRVCVCVCERERECVCVCVRVCACVCV